MTSWYQKSAPVRRLEAFASLFVNYTAHVNISTAFTFHAVFLSFLKNTSFDIGIEIRYGYGDRPLHLCRCARNSAPGMSIMNCLDTSLKRYYSQKSSNLQRLLLLLLQCHVKVVLEFFGSCPGNRTCKRHATNIVFSIYGRFINYPIHYMYYPIIMSTKFVPFVVADTSSFFSNSSSRRILFSWRLVEFKVIDL